MVLKIYSLLRFLITIFIFVALAQQGFIRLEKFQARTVDNLTSVDALIRSFLDCQIYLEKYRLFGQKVLLDEVSKNCALAETKLEELERIDLGEMRETKMSSRARFSIRSIFAVTDSIRGTIKTQKAIINDLYAIHREEDLTKTAISSIGGLRTELEKAVNLTITFKRLTLTSSEVSKSEILHRIKLNWLSALVLILVLYIFELTLIFRTLKSKKSVVMPNPEPRIPNPEPRIPNPPPNDFLILEGNLKKIEETMDDWVERIALMSFNAALLTARAGEENKSLQVMADELKRLTDRSAKQKSVVEKLLAEISQKLADVKSNQG
uniref:Methyl-accepting transducer domain-containing protein n=1 Tax=candidate division WOR-3 bacterium TaxID=2052148 RepID=A0A7C6A8Z8_UNCW3